MADLDKTNRMTIQDMLLSRRTVLRGAAGLSMAAFLAACGGGGDDDESGASDDPTATSGSESDEPTATEATGADSTSMPESSDAEPGTRDVVDAYGETITIPANPQRIVVTDNGALPYVLELGVVPVAAGTLDPSTYGGLESPEALYDLGAGDIEPFSRDEPDIEFVASMNPDLIIGSAWTLENRIAGGADQFRALAPIVAVNDDQPIFDQLRDYATVLGLEDLAEEIIADFEESIRSLAADVPVETISLARTRAEGEVFMYSSEEVSTALWVDLVGVEVVPSPDDEWTSGILIASEERMNELSGDALIIFSTGGPEGLDANPLYDLLPAVQAGNVYEAGDYLIYAGTSGLTALREQIVGIVEFLVSIDGGMAGGEDDFPVTLEHKFGSTTIESAPERVIAIGLVEQDALLALGAVPVATREWFGERPGAIFAWAEDLVGDAELPQRMAYELDFELIASLEPDVIVGLYSGTTQEEYDILSEIAPTVAQPGEHVDWGIPWQELTVKIGQILGKEAEAQRMVGEVEGRFLAVQEEHPEFVGASGAIASPYGLPENYYVYSSQDGRGRLMERIGFVTPEIVDELAGDGYTATISIEQLDIIADLDVLIWVGAEEFFADIPLYHSLPVVQEGRALYYAEGNSVYDAINFSTVLSLPFALEHLVPALAAAIDGDPDTKPGE